MAVKISDFPGTVTVGTGSVLCAVAAAATPSPARTFTPADLSNLLGVEVAWRKEVT